MPFDPKNPPMLINSGMYLVSITRWQEHVTNNSFLRIEVKNHPTMLISSNGEGKFVRWHKTRTMPQRYVYLNKKVYAFVDPFNQPPHTLLKVYEEAVAGLPGHLKGG